VNPNRFDIKIFINAENVCHRKYAFELNFVGFSDTKLILEIHNLLFWGFLNEKAYQKGFEWRFVLSEFGEIDPRKVKF